MDYITNIIFFCTLIIFLIGIYFTIKIRFANFRVIKYGLKELFSRNKNDAINNSFSAASLAIAGRLGSMNIIGVTFGIYYGGLGTIFWLWIFTFLTMSIGFLETILAQVYKTHGDNNQMYSGPMVYMQRGLSNKKSKLPLIYSWLVVITVGFIFQMFHSKSISGMVLAFSGGTQNNQLELAVCILIIIAFIYFMSGGAKQITYSSAYLVPVLLVTFSGLFVQVLLTNLDFVPVFFQQVIESAISPKAFISGTAVSGIVIGATLGQISNETGIGISALSSGGIDTPHPVFQGAVAMVTLLFDNITCTITGFIILLSYNHDTGIIKYENVFSIIINGFESVYDGGNLLVLILVITFSFTSIISSALFGMKALHYIFSEEKYILIRRLYMVMVCLIIAASPVINVISVPYIVIALIPTICILCINYYGIFQLRDVAFKTIADFIRGNRIFNRQSINLHLDDEVNIK